jgi:autotransporter-associated beta strand protein
MFNLSGQGSQLVSAVNVDAQFLTLTISGSSGFGMAINNGGGDLNLSNVDSSINDSSSDLVTISARIFGEGGINVNSGTMELIGGGGAGYSTYGGLTSVSGEATLEDGASNSFSSASPFMLANEAALVVNYSETILSLQGDCGTLVTLNGGGHLIIGVGNNTQAYAGTITGSGGLEIGPGAYQVLEGSNSYGGGTTIDSGAFLQLGNGSGGSITGSVVDNGTLIFDAGACTTFCGGISGTGGVTVDSMLTLMGSGNSYSGTTMVIGAELADANAYAFSASSLIDLTNGASLQVNDDESINGLMDDASGTTVCINDCSTLVITGDDNSYAGVIMGNGSIEIGLGASQTLTGTNTYTGGTTIDCSATLQLGNGLCTGSIVGGVTDEGSLVFDPNGCQTFCGAITGSGSVTVLDGTVTLSSEGNTYSGTTLVNGGRLQDGNSGSLSPNSLMDLTNGGALGIGYCETVNGLLGDCSTAVCIASGATLTTAGSSDCGFDFAGTISGCGSFAVGSGAYEILTGSNTYSGGTTIDCSATLQLGDGESDGTITGCVVDNGTFAFDLADCTSFCGAISGSGNVTLEQGMLTLMGDNSYTGGTYIQNGTSLFVTNSESLGGSEAGALYVTGCSATLATSDGSVCLPNSISLGSGNLNLNFCDSSQLILNGSIYGCGSLTINGPVELSGCNTFSGGTTINDTCVTIASNSGLGTGGVTATTGTLNFTSANPIINDLALAEGSIVNFASGSTPTINNLLNDASTDGNTINLCDAQLTIDVNEDPNFHGTIEGTGSITVSNTGCSGTSFQLSGSNTYSGGTTAMGTESAPLLLVATGASAFGTGTITLNPNTGLAVDYASTVTNPISIPSDSVAIGGYGTVNPSVAQSISIQNGSFLAGGLGSIGTGSGNTYPIVGTLTFGSGATLNLGNGGVLEFSIMNATGTPGTDFSAINATSSAVNVTAGAGGFTIQIIGVDSTGLIPGTANTFNPLLPYQWTLLSAGTLTLPGGPSPFSINTSLFSNAPASEFSVSRVGENLELNFTPVPEPSTWMLMAGGLGALAVGFARRRRAGAKAA